MACVIGLAGLSNSGKTTLITKLTRILCSKGLRVGVIKHDAHGHYKEVENTDSSHFMDSGASAVVLSGKVRVMRFEIPQIEPSLDQLVAEMPELDIILIEGYKKSYYPKIAVCRLPEQIDILNKMNGELLAIVSGFSYIHEDRDVPVYGIDDSLGVAELVGQIIKNTIDV